MGKLSLLTAKQGDNALGSVRPSVCLCVGNHSAINKTWDFSMVGLKKSTPCPRVGQKCVIREHPLQLKSQ